MDNYLIFNDTYYFVTDYAYDVQLPSHDSITLILSFVNPIQVDMLYDKIIKATERNFSLILHTKKIPCYPIRVYKEKEKLIFKF